MNTNTNQKPEGIAVWSILALWFLFALLMGITGRFVFTPEKPPLLFGLSLGLPLLIFVAAYLRHGSFRAFAQTLDLRLIVLFHVMRFVGLEFLATWLRGGLPGGFALPAGIGDTIAALAAVPLAQALSRRPPGIKPWFIAWNIFGLADLVVAVASGILHSQGPLGILTGAGPTTLLMSQFPRSMIPTFFVPLLILLHLLALARAGELEDGAPVAASRA